MFEQCSFTKDDKILIIGCLTGYSVAILSNLVGYVFAVENDKKIVESANKTLYDLNLLNCSVHYKSKLNHGNSKNAPYDKIFIEGSVSNIPMGIVNQLKENGKIYTVIKNMDESIGFFVRGLRVKNGLSFTKIFNTNINSLGDFINESDDYADQY
jgi:protein-L-isoaspartate O-methyltransferase